MEKNSAKFYSKILFLSLILMTFFMTFVLYVVIVPSRFYNVNAKEIKLLDADEEEIDEEENAKVNSEENDDSSDSNKTNENSEVKIDFKYEPSEQATLDSIPEIGCRAAFIADPVTGKVFYEKNAHKTAFPASTTKILTALVVLENCNLDDTAIVSRTALDLVPEGYSNAKLQEGEEVDIKTLLYALLVPSANEAANVLAEYVSGSVEAFAEKCNERARELGCESLHFVNPNGIHDEEHFCSAYDLYLIAKECQKYEVFNEIVKTTEFTMPSTEKYPSDDRVLKNTNELIMPDSRNYYYQYCTGIKTGHTTPAGNCLVASSSKDNLNLISVVLGGGTNSAGLNERFYDTRQLFDFVYDNYKYEKVVEKGSIVKSIEVEKATNDTKDLDLIIDSDIYSIIPNINVGEELKSDIKLNEKIVAPIKQNQKLGTITYHIDGLNYTLDVLASKEVKKIPYWMYNTLFVICVLIVLFIIGRIIGGIRRKNRRRGMY